MNPSDGLNLGKNDKKFFVNQLAWIDEQMQAGEFIPFGMALTQMCSEGMSTAMLICNLRGSFTFRDKIPFWHSARDTAYRLSQARGEDADRIFRGLLDE